MAVGFVTMTAFTHASQQPWIQVAIKHLSILIVLLAASMGAVALVLQIQELDGLFLRLYVYICYALGQGWALCLGVTMQRYIPHLSEVLGTLLLRHAIGCAIF